MKEMAKAEAELAEIKTRLMYGKMTVDYHKFAEDPKEVPMGVSYRRKGRDQEVVLKGGDYNLRKQGKMSLVEFK